MRTHLLLVLCLPVLASSQQFSLIKKGSWEFKLKVDAPKGKSALEKFAHKWVLGAEKKNFDDYVSQAKRDWDPSGQNGGTPWAYEAGSSVSFFGKGILSYTTGCYSYLGGAHGIGVTRTANFAVVNGKPTKVGLWSLLRSSASEKAEVSLLLLGKAAANPNTDWIQDGMVNEFTPGQLERFHVTKTGLMWEFDPYELGSYASGPFSFELSWKELKNLVRMDGPLAKFY